MEVAAVEPQVLSQLDYGQAVFSIGSDVLVHPRNTDFRNCAVS
jgi:hypothetical protein